MRIRLIAPAGPPDPEAIELGMNKLLDAGHEVVLGDHTGDVHGHLAGRDEDRLADLVEALCDEEADLVWALRGGFGCLRLLPGIDWKRLERVGKRPPLLGYSDLTSLQNLFVSRLAWPCWHGPMAATEWPRELDPLSAASLNQLLAALAGAGSLLRAVHEPTGWRLLEAKEDVAWSGRLEWDVDGCRTELLFPKSDVVQPGRTETALRGGNLSVLSSLSGAPCYTPGPCVLMLEDHGEYPFRLDRHLAQLRLSGLLEQVRGVLLGHFNRCDEPDPAKSTFEAEELLLHYLRRPGVPMLRSLPCGHSAPRVCLPLGRTVRLECR